MKEIIIMIYLNKKSFIKYFVLILPFIFIAKIKTNTNKEIIIKTNNQKTFFKLLENEKFKSNLKDQVNKLVKKHAHHWADFAARMNYATFEEAKNFVTKELLKKYNEDFPNIVFDQILTLFKKNNFKELTKQQLNTLKKELEPLPLEADAYNLIIEILLKKTGQHGFDHITFGNNQIVLREHVSKKTTQTKHKENNQKTIFKLLEDETFRFNFKDKVNELVKKYANNWGELYYWANYYNKTETTNYTISKEEKNSIIKRLLNKYNETFPDIVFDLTLKLYKKNNFKNISNQQFNELKKELEPLALEADAYNLIVEILLKKAALHGFECLTFEKNQIVLRETNLGWQKTH